MTGDTRRVNQPTTAAAARRHRQPSRVLLAVVPIGLWSVSLVLDVGSRVAGAPNVLAPISMPLIGLGVFAALGAAMVELVDLLTPQPNTRVFRGNLLHMAVNLAVIGAYIANFWWRDTIFLEAVPVAMGPLVLSAVSLAALVLAGPLHDRPVRARALGSSRLPVRRPAVRRLPR